MKAMRRTLAGLVLAGIVAYSAPAGQASARENLLLNAGLTRVRSGFWPDWWNWYNALGNDRIDLAKCWHLVDEHHVPGTRSVKLSDGAQTQTCFLRILFQKDASLTLSAYLRGDRPDTKVNMYIYQDGWNSINEVSELTVGTEWKRYYVTATPMKTSASEHNFVRIGLAGPGTLWVNAPQLEEGSAPTEWKPSPKDARKKPDVGKKPAKPRFAVPAIDCVRIAKGPVIDGVLDDPAWKEAAATRTFMRLDEIKPARYPTDAYACQDDNNVYIAFRCHEPEMDKITAKQTLYDAVGVFQDDCAEVFLSGNADGSDYLHFAANARGTKADSRGYTLFFDAEWECATGRGEGFWTVEFRIPFSSLVRPLQPGKVWRFNLARFRAGPKAEEYSAWAPVDKTFHDYEHFGFLHDVVAEFDRPGANAASGGRLVATLDRSFYTTESEAKLFLDEPEGTRVRYTLNRIPHEERLPGSQILSIDLSAVSSGEYPLQVTVKERRADIVLRKLPPKETAVKIDRTHRVLLVDDRPFIPVGPNGDTAKTVEKLADHGFNGAYAQMHEQFTVEAQERIRGALDAAHSRGMKIIVWYQNFQWINDHDKWQAELLDVVKTFKEHPAVLGWLVFDEPVSNIKWLGGLCEAVRKADPCHPVFVNWCDRGHGWTSGMGDVTSDINSLDGYYINAYDFTPHEAFLKIGGHCAEMTADAKKRGNVVAYVHGIYGWADAIREPSPAENRFVTYVSLIGGARVLLYYMWGPPASPALRESFKPLCREIEALAPIMANPEVKKKVTCDNKRIAYTAFETAEGLCIIALNTDENNERARFRIEAAGGEAAVLFENRTRVVTERAFRDEFKPLERHVYRLRSVPGSGVSPTR